LRMAESEKRVSKKRKIKNFYKLEKKKLGTGAFSNVVLGRSIETDEPVAIKVIKKPTHHHRTRFDRAT